MTKPLVLPGVGVLIILLLAACIELPSQSESKSSLSKADRDSIFEGNFTIVKDTDGIPVNIKQSFAEVTREPSFALANPGQEYQATDVVNSMKPRLPWRRLIFAGRSGDKWFIHYEKGGIGHYYAIVLLSAKGGNRPQLLWGGVGFSGAQNLAKLRALVLADRFSERYSYY